ncbi:STAS domain-containing protein [Actinoplanes sp. NEAU-A12]|uniref:Anti-sigma factor antagonist n=1 Tax=Actinoplanes sandaracinus TaxID=3045177 RepID=A0ABT6WKZ1_9ACTN|nr:STAS domain-containing protein [Actinoplanes sandaracinus]MDI6100351.1 STAS domain-containing protein [Actinoplanes sandaracinus]
MDISTDRRSEKVVHVVVSGEIDMETVDAVRRAVTEALRTTGVEDVLVDMAGVTFCDSSGIAVFDETYQTAAEQGVRFRLFGVRPGVRRVLEIVGLLEPLTAPLSP